MIFFIVIKDEELHASSLRWAECQDQISAVENSVKAIVTDRHGSFREMKDQYQEMQLSFKERIDELTLQLSASTQQLDDLLDARRAKNAELDAVIDARKSEIDTLSMDMEQMIKEFSEVLCKIHNNLNSILNVPRLVDKAKLSNSFSI